jgi:hypothetical protein
MIVEHVVSHAPAYVLPWVPLYIGPDAFLPITSALAAIAGVALMFWNRLVSAFRKLYQMVTRRPR